MLCIAFSHISIGQTVYKNNVQRTAESILQESTLKNASFSFYVFDATSDSAIANIDGDRTLVPASTMKILSTATALRKLGSSYRFKTKLEHDGYIDTLTGILHGNIYIKGGGDPTLGSKYFKKEKEQFKLDWIEAIKSKGIKKINGAIIGDASYYTDDMIPASWIWGDIGNYYGAGPSGLTVYDNLFYIDFKSGENAGDSTWVECIRPYQQNLNLENRVKAAKIKSDQAYIFGAPYEDYKLINGRIPMARDSFSVKGAIADPSFQIAFDLTWMLRNDSVDVSLNPTTVRRLKQKGISTKVNRNEIHVHKSPSLARIVYYTNMFSVNLYAEHCLREVAKKQYKDGSNYSGTIAIDKYWKSKGVDTRGMHVNDGSGLSRQNAISAKHLVGVLKYMRNSNSYKTFYSSLPVAGKTGTLKSMCKGTAAQGNLRAKSGTMTRVKSYAGYVTSKSGKKLVFAMILNNFQGKSSLAKKKLEKIMVAMANYY